MLRAALEAFSRKDLHEVERLCRAILAASPGPSQAMQLLADVLAATDRPAEAVALFQQINSALYNSLATYRSNYGVAVLHKLGFRPTGILDVGAYHGEWTQLVRHYYPEARFLMIEAQPKLESVLKAVAAADPNRIEYRMALLGPERRDAVNFFQMDIPITTGSSLYAEQTLYARSVVQLPMVRLDDVARGGKFQLLKIDVQGAELDVLEGAPNTLANVEALFLELSLVEYNKGAPLIADVIAAVKARDFLLSDLYPAVRNSTGSLLQVDAVFLRRDSPLLAKLPFF